MAYSSVEDLLIGKIPLPVGVDPQKYVDDATDEVDSYIGFTYVTPVDVSNTSPVDRPVRPAPQARHQHDCHRSLDPGHGEWRRDAEGPCLWTLADSGCT
jgi:hypothetical protein